MKKPYGMTVFCDDIRDEQSNKKIYLGVYTSELIIDGPFPAVLPTFGFAITYLEPFEDEVEPVSIRIIGPSENHDEEELFGEVQLPPNRPARPESQVPDNNAEYRAAILPIRMSPLVVHREGYIKVRAYRGKEEIRLGSLRIRQVADLDELPAG